MTELVLASQSTVRSNLLRQAGVGFIVRSSGVDESEIKRGGVTDSKELADLLAAAKAERVSLERPEDYVLGCDQVLECDGVLLDKPESILAARDQLETLRGRTHRLVSSLCIAVAGRRRWSDHRTAVLTMRNFSDEFLRQYLEAEGEAVCDSVGGYKLEGLGVQLFERVEGDYTTILGLPLLPLLAYLRSIDFLKG